MVSAFVLALGLVLGQAPADAANHSIAPLLVGGPREAGVDRAGRLWTWRGDLLEVFDHEGRLLWKRQVTGAEGVAVDGEWGVAILTDFGKAVHVLPVEGERPQPLLLKEVYKALAWIDGRTLALAPAFTDRRVELWDLAKGERTAALGEEEPIEPTVGTRRARVVKLLYRPDLQLLYTIETFTGEVELYRLDGRRIHRHQVEDGDRERFDRWLQVSDREARAASEVRTPTISRFQIAVDEQGDAWTVESCDHEKAKATLLRIPLQGTAKRQTVDAACCSSTFVIRGDELGFYRSPRPGFDACHMVRRLR